MNFPRPCLLLALLLAMPIISARADVMRLHSKAAAVGPNPCAVAVGDLTGDGLPDIVTADRGVLTDPREERPANDELSLLIAQAPLEYEKRHPSLKTGFGPYAVTLANIDALKWPDIVVASFHAVRHRDLYLYLNIRQEDLFKPEFFRVPDEHLPYVRHEDGDGQHVFTTPGLTSVAVRDLDGDGLRDALATGWSSDVLLLWPGHAETYWGAPRFMELEGGPRDIVLGDFNGDGHTDAAVTMHTTGEIALLEGDGALGFTQATRFLSRGRLPHKIRTADMNQDGRPDLVVSHVHTDDSVVIFHGDGDFRFGNSLEVLLAPDREVLEKEVRDIALGDFNADGWPDVAAACMAAGEVQLLLSAPGRADAPLGYTMETHAMRDGQPHALAAADLNGDGVDDLAVALWGANEVRFLLSTAERPESSDES